jgi:RNA polymerase sigma factor (TIGR02999 family)
MGPATPESVTFWLRCWKDGHGEALEQLTRLVYADLRRLAARYLQREDPGHTLQATALVHEFYLRVAPMREIDWKDRAHFISVAAQMMRRILIDHARKRRAAKRDIQQAGSLFESGAASDPDVLVLDRAIEKLAAEYPRHARIVELRFFGGLHSPEIAQMMEVSLRTVERDWHFAKAWLQNEIS